MYKLLRLKPVMAIMKADILSLTKNPSTIVFNLGFPIIFILVLGFISNAETYFKIIVDKKDSATLFYQTIQRNPAFVLEDNNKKNEAALLQGKIIARVVLQTNQNQQTEIHFTTATSAMDKFPLFEAYFKNYIREALPNTKAETNFVFTKAVVSGRKFQRIDFLLPGMLGFSLLSAGLFSVAYAFFGLRQNMVFKRMFCTPVSKTSILLGFLSSRMLFQFFNSIILITLGYFVFDFTLIHGLMTFFQLMLLSVFGMICFMSWGFFISGVAKNDAVIPALTNILSLPQWLLGGAFFSNEGFPTWLKTIANILPLTRLNDGLRKIAFDGADTFALLPDMAVIALWTLLGLFLSKKFFRWE